MQPGVTVRDGGTGRAFLAAACAVVLGVVGLAAGIGYLSVAGADEHRPYRWPGCPAMRRPLISIEFDDGYRSAFETGRPEVARMGWTATLNAITATPDPATSGTDEPYMTPEQIVEWSRWGPVHSHTRTHRSLATLDAAQLRDELAGSRADLERLIGRPVEVVAAPGCAVGPAAIAEAKRVYSAMRLCSDLPTAWRLDRYDLGASLVTRNWDDTTLRAAIERARANNGWLILVYHHVLGTGTPRNDSYVVSRGRLRHELELVAQSGIDVVSSDEALAEVTGGAIPVPGRR